jgi:hypothetical protein
MSWQILDYFAPVYFASIISYELNYDAVYKPSIDSNIRFEYYYEVRFRVYS